MTITRSPLRITLGGGTDLPCQAMAQAGLEEVRFRFDFKGTRALFA